MSVWVDPDTGAELWTGDLECSGSCLTGFDVGVPYGGVAYAHPMCPLHGDADPWPDPAVALAACDVAIDGLVRKYESGT